MGDINQIAYDIQKVRKQLHSDEVSFKEVQCKLWSLRKEIAGITAGKKIAGMITRAIEYGNANPNNTRELNSLLQSIYKQVQSMKVKSRISSTRRDIAMMEYQAARSIKTKEIHMYDVVKAPTEGGLHYCIVGDITEDRCMCYPMTTTSKRSLQVLGRKFYSIKDPFTSSDVYLTDACTCLPHTKAKENFVQHMEPSVDIINAINLMRHAI